MTRQSEFLKKYNSDTGKFTRQHIWSGERYIFGEGITDKVKSLFGKKTKKKTGKICTTSTSTQNNF